MVHVDVDAELGARVRIAAELARRFDAHLIGVGGWAPMSVFLAEQAKSDPAPSEPHLQDMKSLLDLKGRQFCAAIGGERRRVEWRSMLDFPTDAMLREARAADLVIVGNAAENRDPFRALDPAAVLLKAGRPALIVPEGVSALRAEHVVIGWKDTREARRAVRDALPLLQRASRVTIVEACPLGQDEAALGRLDDVARYLTRHRIETGSRVMLEQRGSGAEQLLRIAHDENADLLVAGAYGHSRLGEWAFGGMTWELLATSPICCLMSH
jgi:nucleotide-binding universal stress UspA family protein